MIIAVVMKSGSIYNTKAIELINNSKDLRFDSFGHYVIIDVSQIKEIRLV